MDDLTHVVLDDSAMVAAGRGNRRASWLINRANNDTMFHLFAPTCALVEADRSRPGTAEHIAAQPGVEMLPLDLAAALTVARDGTWGIAHTRHSAEEDVERPSAAVATTVPERWKGQRIEVVDLNR